MAIPVTVWPFLLGPVAGARLQGSVGSEVNGTRQNEGPATRPCYQAQEKRSGLPPRCVPLVDGTEIGELIHDNISRSRFLIVFFCFLRLFLAWHCSKGFTYIAFPQLLVIDGEIVTWRLNHLPRDSG